MSLNRRRFMQSSAAGAAGAAGAAFAAKGVPAATLPTRPYKQRDLDALARALRGRLLRPGEDGFSVAAAPNASRWADVRPSAVALCVSPDDVQACVRWLRERTEGERDFAVRSGGHNYAGFSTTTGLLINVKPMNGVLIDRKNGTATIGAGASNQDLADALRGAGLALPSGRCPTVGTSGLVLGGGWGFAATRHGLTCDSLRLTDVVTADGVLRHAADGLGGHADLFWAARGGGGGNFGVHTGFTFDLYDVSTTDVTVFNIVRPATHHAELMMAIQEIQAENGRSLSTRTKIAPSQPGVPTRKGLHVQTFGQFWGSPGRFRDVMAKVLSIATPEIFEVDGLNYWSAHDYVVTDDPLGFYDLRSRYMRDGLSGDAVETMLTHMTRWPGGSMRRDNMGILFAIGGKVKDKAPSETAYAHREADYILELETTWSPLDRPNVVQRQKEWLAAYFEAMEPYVLRQSYVNVPSRDLPDWQRAYYGENLERLSQIKLRCDPDELFGFPRSVPLPRPRQARNGTAMLRHVKPTLMNAIRIGQLACRAILGMVASLPLLVLAPNPSQANPVSVTWAIYDAPPFMIGSGPDVGAGIFDRIRRLLDARMTDVSTHTLQAPFPRVLASLRDGAELCFIGGVEAPERDAYAAFSLPVAMFYPLRVAVHAPMRERFAARAPLKLPELLADQGLRTSFLRNRSLGARIDAIVQQARPTHAYSEFGEAFRMLLADRLDFLVEYSAISHYQAEVLGQSGDVAEIPLAETPEPVFSRVMCPKTEWGRSVVARVDDVLRVERPTLAYRRIVEAWTAEEDLAKVREVYDGEFLHGR